VLEIIYFQLLKEPFDVHIKKFLKHNVSQPILKLGLNADPSPQECMEVRKYLTSSMYSIHFSALKLEILCTPYHLSQLLWF
jgi:hypothetical protein